MTKMGGSAAAATAAARKSSFSFPIGSPVEVSSDEEGFKGVWFPATVLYIVTPVSKNKPPRVCVEYKTLLSENGSEPLRECAEISFVRPPPPPEELDSSPNFQLDVVVDAYYRDGWWTGVITSLVDDSGFVVSFQNPPDEIVFGISDLRVHREWLAGKWVLPEKQRTAGLMFSAGKKVEVSFEKEDYRDVWFPATVLEGKDNGSFLVECQFPGIGDDESGWHKVIVDHLHIRPSPPHLRDKVFVLLEKVDAFFDFGWWSGVITKELADSRYIVFFKLTNKEKELDHSELRPHMDWKDGKWFSASQDILIPSANQGPVGHVGNTGNGSETAVLHDESGIMEGETGLKTPSALNSVENKVEDTTACLEKLSVVSDDTYSQPPKKLKEANVANALCQLSTSHSIVPSQENFVGCTSPTAGYTGTPSSEETRANNQLSAKTESFFHGKKLRSKRGKSGEFNNLVESVKRLGRPPRSLQGSVQGNLGNSAKVAKDIVSIPVVIGLESNGVKNARAKKLHPLAKQRFSPKQTRRQDEQLGDSLAPIPMKNKEENNPEGGAVSTPKRKRGRPPKVLAKSPPSSRAVNQQNEDATPNQTVSNSDKMEVASPTSLGIESMQKKGQIPEEEHLNLVEDNSPKLKNTLSSVMKISFPKKDKLQEVITPVSTEQPKKISLLRGKRGRRRTISINTESSIQDSQELSKEKVGESSGKDEQARKDDMPVDVLPSTMSDDQPLSMWFEGMHPPTTVDFSGAELVGRTEEQQIEPSGRQNEINLQTSAGGDTVPGREIQSLPFVKNTPLWETIGSMEVFRMIPQKPHFRPLDRLKESSREGLAIGSMVTFASVVEKTSGLQFDNPRSTIEDYLETLVDLESHGFDVKVVRDRLKELLLIKDKQEELQNQSDEIRSRIVEHNEEKCKIDEEINEIDKQILELEQKRSLAMSMKENKNSEIRALEKMVFDITEGISGTQLKFGKLAASPW